ncbi:unnamed protein product [marine sediment metagenome]|uniref:Recombination endonuclease VII n=1 Tax=marine sediment metagenome TaxID=412755 RepID=X0ZGA6_9ZZZZ
MLQKIKICSKCKRKLSATTKFFCQDKRRKDGLANPCKRCKRKYEQSKHARFLDWKRSIEHRYGLKIIGYNKLFNTQNGCCAVCGRHQSELKRRLDVDHNHQTDKIRGLLCNYCNKIVERHINSPLHFKNPAIINKLNEYLES